ncbi:hypothetical protein [Pelagicoccus sp. SDUM812002]|uniref:hypothetical protein n=1 Tax=Pelagicoccus sp. SDUM812002 TaxID=3041266 RepID=UPI00280F8DCB|nr:hypothetical protein [Pelagicoccus sp. SDUM812002]MDQ8185780.1 hypothetical protein [Pelagicoccus sp. SDUM812002]
MKRPFHLKMRYRHLLLILSLCFAAHAAAERVYILHDSESPQAAYAAGKLATALTELDHEILAERQGYERLISLGLNTSRLGPEQFQVIPENKVVTVLAGDDRGLIYGTYSLIEKLRNGTPLTDIPEANEKPALKFRGIKFNLPWETYRPSSALDQHYDTVRDLKYWEAFLDMMAENRFNVISLWNMNPFTYMVKPKNFPEASPWTEEQQAEWETLYREIFRMAKERALDTYIVQWSIFTSEEFSKAHGIAEQSFYPHYYVPGDTSELLRRYLRESVTQILDTYPELDGIGISHGEGMADMTPLERQRWMDDVMIAGMLDADREVKLIHRVPFSSGTSSDPGVSKNVEQVTREAMERLDDRFDGPIWVEMKFNWSHAHSTPKLVKVHGGKLGDTYFDPLPKNYKITWQARNEDFFCLRWGVPSFVREHIALNGQASYVGGYFIGSETYIPALDYFTDTDQPVDWTYAFQRQWLFYKLWGRLLYEPETPDSLFQAEFDRRYGDSGNNLLNAYSLASSTQLRLASLYDSRWDFTLYSEGFLALQGEITKYIGIEELIEHPTMDPAYVSISEYVATRINGGSFAVDRVTPLALASTLERDNLEALSLVSQINTSDSASLMYEVADIKAWAYIGLHLAEKLRGGVALQTYRLNGDLGHRQAAIEHLTKALAHWDSLVEITRPIYKDMRLTHYNHNSFDANPDNLFHWALIRDEVAQDVEVAKGEE